MITRVPVSMSVAPNFLQIYGIDLGEKQKNVNLCM